MHLGAAGVAAGVAALLASAASAGVAATPVNGTLKIQPFNPNASCKFSPTTMKVAARPIAAGSHALLAQCGGTKVILHASFTGSPATTGAGYGWNWYLAVGKNGKTTGVAAEYGQVVLVPAAGAQIVLLTTGNQQPVGPQTSAHAKGLTKGTWRAVTGTGSGTYTFTTERKGSTFTTATLHLSGAIG